MKEKVAKLLFKIIEWLLDVDIAYTNAFQERNE